MAGESILKPPRMAHIKPFVLAHTYTQIEHFFSSSKLGEKMLTFRCTYEVKSILVALLASNAY